MVINIYNLELRELLSALTLVEAVANIRKNVPENLQGNGITIHKLLEYQPVYYEVTDPETGKERTTMRRSHQKCNESTAIIHYHNYL